MFNTLSDIATKYNVKFSNHYNKYEEFMLNLFNCETNTNYNAIITKIEETKTLNNDGMIYNILGLYNRYVTKNYKEVEKNYKIAISKGNIKALNNIADYYRVITKNYKEMETHFKLGCKKGDSSAMKNLGNYYSTIKNYKQMKKYYKMAIDKGSALAMNDMGIYHHKITRNHDEAEKYYKMALAAGYYESLLNLGYLHESITHNYNEMINYYCTYFKTITTINTLKIKLIQSKYYLDIYCNLDKINRTKLDKMNTIYEFEARLQSHLHKINNINNLSISHISNTTNNLSDSTNTHEQNSLVDTSELTTCNICMESSNELISWDCHISHIVCNKCYPHIRRKGKCHMCRSNII